MDDLNFFKKAQELLQDLADTAGNLIKLKEKEINGEDITKEFETLLGRFMIKSMELESLK